MNVYIYYVLWGWDPLCLKIKTSRATTKGEIHLTHSDLGRDKTAHIKIKKGGLRFNTMHTDISSDVKTKN